MDVEKNEKKIVEVCVWGGWDGEWRGSTGARQRWQAVKVAVTL